MGEAKQFLGEIENSETKVIESVMERLAGLEELLLIVEDAALSAKIKNEMSELHQQCNNWWKTLLVSHGWVVNPNTRWEIDYQENKVWLY